MSDLPIGQGASQKALSRLGFALEYSLGHVTHAENLKRFVAVGNAEIAPTYIDLPYEQTPVGRWANLPGVRSNWSVRASLGAYLGLRRCRRNLDAALFHTQVTSLFSTGFMHRVPSVVSLDATPLQYDALGAFYGHAAGGGRIETLKKTINIRAFAAARHLVAWSEWTKTSLVNDYGVVPEKVTVIPPGIDTALWNFGPHADKGPEATVDLLFVGGDFARKGGDTLLRAFDALPVSVRQRTRLHLVTKTEGVAEGRDNVQVYHGLSPNSAPLRQLFQQADAFVFPTRGDCLPLAVMEALASGLPVITTAVGALPEAVTHGETGLVTPSDDVPALASALETLVADGSLRTWYGKNARAAALARFDAAINYARLIQTITQQIHP